MRQLLLVTPILLCTLGCGTLFNQQRSDSATAAQKKFTEIKLSDLLKEERKHNAELLTREIDIAQRQMKAGRDAKLIVIVSDKDVAAKLGDSIKERTHELQGDDTKIAGILIRVEQGEENLRAAGDAYVIRRMTSDPKLDCSGDDAAVSDRAKSNWARVQNRCENLAKWRVELAKHANAGMIGKTATGIAATEQARDELAARLKTAEKEARETAKRLAVAQKNGKASVVLDPETLKKLKEEVANVTIPSEAQLSSAGIEDVRIAAALRWTEMQKAAIDKILAAATSGATEPPAGTSDALQIAAVLPTLAAQLQEGFRYPRVSALVMEWQRLRIDADRYRQQLARVDEELALLRAKLLRLRAETSALSDATSKLNEGKTDQALARYAESWTVSRIPMVATDWRLIGLAHERALDQSEAALAQWDALIRTPLEALAASASSGLKPDEIARLLHAVELGVITVGVY